MNSIIGLSVGDAVLGMERLWLNKNMKKSRHYVRADVIEWVVMLELRRMANFLRDNEQEFAEILAQKSNAEMLKRAKA